MSGRLPSEKSLVVNSAIDEFSLNDFTEKERIGRGGEGEIFRGYNGRLGKVAFKRLKRQVNKADVSEVILLAKHSNHSNIIRLFGLLTPVQGYSPNNRSFCIGYIMEYMKNGSLFDVIHNISVAYDMKQVYSWIEKASSGLRYLHEEGILHRDINPKNILLGISLDDLRISDFGLAKAVEPQTIASQTGGKGTVAYMAPELHNRTNCGKPTDIYSLTITFWEIIHRERPYGYMGIIPQYRQITRIVNGERPNIQEELEISTLLIRGWDSNPESRPEISEFIEFARKKRSAQENLRKVKKQSEGQQNTSILILGGSGCLNAIYLLDSKAQNWKKLSITLPVGIEGSGAVMLNEEIYIFGGYAKGYRQDCYKLKNDGSLMQLAPLNQRRYCISSSSLVYKGDIWVIGGYSGDFIKCLKSVEKYNISEDKWTYMPEMNYPRYSAAAAVFKDRIFVTGGRNNEYFLKSVEMFDPELQKWILFCDLPIEVSGHTMLISNSTLSIFGGQSGFDSLNSVWEMDIENPEKKWTENQRFNNSRACFGIGKLSNGIIVFSGCGGNGETSEIFDGNEWIDGPMLPQKISDFAYTSIPRSLAERFLEQFFREKRLDLNNLIPDAQNVVRTENKVEKLSKGQQNTSVLILGGWTGLDTIYLLDSKAQSWKKLRITLPMEMHDFGAVVLNDEIYIFGGEVNYTYHKHCYKLKDDGSWIKLASLNQGRYCISSSSLVYKGDIWAIGGSSKDYSLNSVEKYDIFQDKWTYIAKMNYERCNAAAAVFKDRIFVTGGYNEKRLKSVEMFDPDLQKWILFWDLPFGLYSHTMLINNSTLSIFGGYSESRTTNSVWEMDLEDPAKKWTEKQSFNHPRSDFGIGKFSNGIIVFGGFGNSGKTSEIFDGNEWIDGPWLPQQLSTFAYTSISRSFEESFLKKFS